MVWPQRVPQCKFALTWFKSNDSTHTNKKSVHLSSSLSHSQRNARSRRILVLYASLRFTCLIPIWFNYCYRLPTRKTNFLQIKFSRRRTREYQPFRRGLADGWLRFIPVRCDKISLVEMSYSFCIIKCLLCNRCSFLFVSPAHALLKIFSSI